MIKRITTLINSKLLLPPQQHYRFSSGKETQTAEQQIQQTEGQQLKQQVQAALQTGAQIPAQVLQGVQGQTIVPQQIRRGGRRQQQQVNMGPLHDSNWSQMARHIHTNYYVNKYHPFNLKQVQRKLQQMQGLYGFDLLNLDRVKIMQQKQFELKKLAVSNSYELNRYVQNPISQNSKIGYGLMTNKKFKQLIESKQLRALRYLYQNGQFNYFGITNDIISRLIDITVQSNWETQFYLNFIAFGKFNEGLLKVNKNFQKVLQNIHNLNQVNKLKFLWSVCNKFQNGQQIINHNIINYELSKITYEGFDRLTSQKQVHYIYNSILGRQAMKKLTSYSFNKYNRNFQELLLFWGLVNLLLARLTSLNQITISQTNNLNAIFGLIQMNLADSREIIAQLLPQILNETKNRYLFEIYRSNARKWLQKRNNETTAVNNTSVNLSIFDQFINNKIQFQDNIRITYQPFSATNNNSISFQNQNWSPIYTFAKTSKNVYKATPRQDQILNQTKMIQHLLKGEYNFVLNYFLVIYYSALDKRTYNEIRSILHEADKYQFEDQNVKALYLLKQINQKCVDLGEPVSFKLEFLETYKTIKALERQKQRQLAFPKKQKRIHDEPFEERGKFSRKRDQTRDPVEPYSDDNKERIRNKPKKYPQYQTKTGGGALFKKNKQQFSTASQKATTLQPDSYKQYRQVVKDLTQSAPQQYHLSFDPKIDKKQFLAEIQKKSKQINEKNHKSLFLQSQIPIIGSGSGLIKYLFLQKPIQKITKVDQRIKKRLQVSFISQIGALQKDFSQYLQNCRFNFALAPEVYVSLLQQQKVNYVRKSFKTIVSHIIGYRNEITHRQVQLICQIAQRNRIGITLIQIYSLLIDNKISVAKESIYTFCDTLQKFKKINNDIFLMTKKYCQNLNIDFEMRMLSSYARSLLVEQQDQILAELCEILKTQLKPKPYKVKTNLSTDQNIKLQKQYKQVVKKQYNKVLLEIVDLIVHNVNNKLPAFVSDLFDQYQKTKTKLNARQIAISLIVYCNNVEKFLSIIRMLRENPSDIVLDTFECAIKALRLNVRQLQSHSQQIFNVTLFKHNFILNQDLVTKTIQLFKLFQNPTVFIKFLQYVLRYNIPMNYEIKNLMYFVMNNINDDFSKNTISGFLDFIFNNNREKERQQYRKEQIVQEEKAKLLSDLEKKQVIPDILKDQTVVAAKVETPNKKPQKSKTAKQNIQKQLAQDVIVDSNKSAQAAKLATQDLSKQKTVKPSTVNKQKRSIKLKTIQSTLDMDQGDGVLKKSSLKKKLRNKSLNDFEQMFTQKQQAPEQAELKDAKSKGLKQPAKEQKKAHNKKKGGK